MSKKNPGFTSIKNVLDKFNPTQAKYISREFQSYGVYLSQQLDDPNHKSLYIKLAKTTPRHLLQAALTFVKSSKARSKPKLFMWKLSKLKNPPLLQKPTLNKDTQ